MKLIGRMIRGRSSSKAKPSIAGRLGALAAVVGALGITGCSHHEASPPATAPSPAAPAGTSAQIPPPAASSSRPQIVAYKLAPAGDTAADPNGLAPTPVALPTGTESPAKDALADVISGPNSPLPKGTRLLSLKIDPSSKLATVDFSRQFRDNFHGGDTREAQAVMSVLQTLGQFPDVRSVQFLVAGRKIDSLGGTEELDEPLPTPQSTSTVASTVPTENETASQ